MTFNSKPRPQLITELDILISCVSLSSPSLLLFIRSYQEKVRAYTHYKIGRKLPQSTRLFTEEEINSHRLKIQNPQILRILTKWCEELSRKFQSTEYFEHFISCFNLEKSTFLSMMMGEVRSNLQRLIGEERKLIEEELRELASNNYFMQSSLLLRKLRSVDYTQIDHYERIAAQFSIGIVNNLHSYVIAYLNRLIHGLLTVFQRFQQLPLSQQVQISSKQNLITFQVMDLLRCKCSSKEKEVMSIYQQLMKVCQDNPNIELVRVVNRLKRGTNDVLINIKYRDVLCEIQLAVANKNNTFLEYSNTFNHYLYQLKRSVFGPLTELCGIWKNLDSRFNTYSAIGAGQRIEEEEGAHECLLNTFISYNKPFICSVCSQHYYHNKFIKRHIKCKICDFWMCARCQINRSNCKELLGSFNSQEFIKNSNKLDGHSSSIPNYGICIYVQSQETVIQPFRKFHYKESTKIIGITNKNIYQIYDISSERSQTKFLSKFVVFSLEKEYGQRHIKISEEAMKQFLTAQRYKHALSKNKDYMQLNNQNITDDELDKLFLIGKQQQKNRIKTIQIIGNSITSTQQIASTFKNVTKLQLSKNKLSNFDGLTSLKKLQKVNLNCNDIKQFPQQLCKVTSLKQICLNSNVIKSFPESLGKCTQLSSIEMSSNKLPEIPSFVFQLKKLIQLNLTNNFIDKLPSSIGAAKKLRHLSLRDNYIGVIPKEIAGLVDLERLNLSYNKIETIPCIATLQNLKHINLRRNNIEDASTLFNTPLRVKEIDLSYNKLRTVDQIDCFQRLTFLNLNHNQLFSFPSFGKSCINLKHLLITNNKLTTMRSLQTLNNLEELQLSDNQLQELHSSLNKLPKLSILQVENNRLERLNNLLMERLVRLQLKHNKITEARGLNMKNLEEIDLSENQLTSFELNYLPKIRRINLTQNKLQKLDLGTYHRISIVQVARNSLTQVPWLQAENQLKVINLENNEISQITKPILASNHLRSLNLAGNKIRRIPLQLQNLTCIRDKELILSNNPIETIQCIGFIIAKALDPASLPIGISKNI